MMLIATGFQTEIKFYGKYRAKKVPTNRNQALPLSQWEQFIILCQAKITKP